MPLYATRLSKRWKRCTSPISAIRLAAHTGLMPLMSVTCSSIAATPPSISCPTPPPPDLLLRRTHLLLQEGDLIQQRAQLEAGHTAQSRDPQRVACRRL